MKIFWKKLDRTHDRQDLKEVVGYSAQRASVSHTGQIWACAVGQKACGLDIERADNADIKGISDRYFSQEEKDYVKIHDKPGFLRLWTAKEALAKLYGKSVFSMLGGPNLVVGGEIKSPSREISLYIKDDFCGSACLALASLEEIEPSQIEIIEIDDDFAAG